jgi:hypothetical protein
MPYEQQGNSCGAWCAAHRMAIGKPALLASANAFTARALFIYGRVRFNAADGDAAWTPARRHLFSQWCAQGYSDPWRIVSMLRWSGINAALCTEVAAIQAGGPLGEMRYVLEHLGTRGGNPVNRGNLGTIGAGAYAIGVFQSGAGLHYLLLKNAGPMQVYDPRSQQLNWRNLGAAPAFGGAVSTTIMNPGPVHQNYAFLGVFVTC